MEMHVRLKAPDRRRGQVLRRYTYRGIKFVAGHGWYRVSGEVAAHLRTVRQAAGDDTSPLAFDVCTAEEAERRDVAEQAATRATRATEAVPVGPRPSPAEVAADDRAGVRRPRRDKE
jgi:hypothetical protein